MNPRGYEYRSTVVCIDTYENSVPGGRFYNTFRKEGESFHGLMQFLLKMEWLLNTMSFPKAYACVRSFSRPPEPAASGPPEARPGHGRLATFEIRILFRQNTSWQGSLAWLEGEQEESFRSVLELALLLESALNAGDLGRDTA